MFDNTIALFTGGTFWELENEDPNAVYYESYFDDADAVSIDMEALKSHV